MVKMIKIVIYIIFYLLRSFSIMKRFKIFKIKGTSFYLIVINKNEFSY